MSGTYLSIVIVCHIRRKWTRWPLKGTAADIVETGCQSSGAATQEAADTKLEDCDAGCLHSWILCHCFRGSHIFCWKKMVVDVKAERRPGVFSTQCRSTQRAEGMKSLVLSLMRLWPSKGKPSRVVWTSQRNPKASSHDAHLMIMDCDTTSRDTWRQDLDTSFPTSRMAWN